MHFLNNIIIPLIQIAVFLPFIFVEHLNYKRPLKTVNLKYIIFDELMHVIFFMIVMLPFAVNYRFYISGIIFCALIDIDHIISSKTFKLKDLVSMQGRPMSHSFAFAFLLSIILLMIFKDLSFSMGVLWGLSIHFFRDMIDEKTYIFFPFKRINSINFRTYTLFSVVIIFISHIIYFGFFRSF